MLDIKKIKEETSITKFYEIKYEGIVYTLIQIDQKAVKIKIKDNEYFFGIFLSEYSGEKYEDIKDKIFNVFTINDFALNIERLYFYNTNTNTFFDNKLQPTMAIYELGSEGIIQRNNKDKIFFELFELFKSHPYIKNCSIEKVLEPLSDFYGQKYIKMSVVIPREKMIEMYKYYSGERNISSKVFYSVVGKLWAKYRLYGDEIGDKLIKFNELKQEYTPYDNRI